MLLIEINEFNPELLEVYANRFKLSNIKRMLTLCHTATRTIDLTERHGLDPWVQWVSMHTGQPSKSHGVKHLGDISQLSPTQPQIWDRLFKEFGVRYSVWGAMNASFKYNNGCDVFFPDPWTYTEAPHPKSLNTLMEFPRFYAKNYLNLRQFSTISSAFRTTSFFFKKKNLKIVPSLIRKAFGLFFKLGLNTNTLFILFDLLNTELFLKYCKNSQFKVLFINSIAHLQHHYWTDESHNKNIEYCLKNLDAILDKIFTEFPNEPLLFANAFRQVQSYHKYEFLYRQIDPNSFLNALGIKFKQSEQLMTNDSHVIFNNKEDMSFAYSVLRSATINGNHAFHVEQDPKKLKVFFQFTIWENLSQDTALITNDQTFAFYKFFEKIVQRTGSHIPAGDIYAKGINLPSKMFNHEIYEHIFNHYLIQYDHSHTASI